MTQHGHFNPEHPILHPLRADPDYLPRAEPSLEMLQSAQFFHAFPHRVTTDHSINSFGQLLPCHVETVLGGQGPEGCASSLPEDVEIAVFCESGGALELGLWGHLDGARKDEVSEDFMKVRLLRFGCV